MNYGQNYYNPYAQYPYSAYSTPTQQPVNQYQQQNMYQQQTQQQSQAQTQQYFPLTKVNGIEGAKAFIVQPNQIYYLLDVEDMVLFEKKLDNQGNPILEPYQLIHKNIQDLGKKNVEETQVDFSSFVKKQDLGNFATIEDVSRINIKLDESLDRLSRQIDALNSRGSRSYIPQTSVTQVSKKENE